MSASAHVTYDAFGRQCLCVRIIEKVSYRIYVCEYCNILRDVQFFQKNNTVFNKRLLFQCLSRHRIHTLPTDAVFPSHTQR